MNLFLISIVSIAVWTILALISTNLVGLVLRGLFEPMLPVGNSSERVNAILAKEAHRHQVVSKVIAGLSAIAAYGFIYWLLITWNAFLALAAILLILGRLPDLLWEIKNGGPITKYHMPQGSIYVLSTLLHWFALPVTWYSLYLSYC